MTDRKDNADLNCSCSIDNLEKRIILPSESNTIVTQDETSYEWCSSNIFSTDSDINAKEKPWEHSHHPALTCTEECTVFENKTNQTTEFMTISKILDDGNEYNIEWTPSEWQDLDVQSPDISTMSLHDINMLLCRLSIEENVAVSDRQLQYTMEKEQIMQILEAQYKHQAEEIKEARKARMRQQWEDYQRTLFSITLAEGPTTPITDPKLGSELSEFQPPVWFVPLDTSCTTQAEIYHKVVKKHRFDYKAFMDKLKGKQLSSSSPDQVKATERKKESRPVSAYL